MKKFIPFFLLNLVTLSVHAQTCPPIDAFFIHKGAGRYDLVAPPGWLLTADNRTNFYSKNHQFLLTAWGDHKHNSDSVRCHYYDPNYSRRITLETRDRFLKSAVEKHASWQPKGDALYYDCPPAPGFHDVSVCPFN